jgi:DNA-binding response OmpR family regulator
MARIILITDDQALARMTLWILSEQMHEALSCPDAEKAIASFPELSPDIVIFDGPLSDEKRRNAERMYNALPGLQLIGLHDHKQGPGERHIRAEAHLHKPFHADDLIGVVDELLMAK